jgi:hypothetical protein
MLVNGITVKNAHLREQLCLPHPSDEQAEGLRRLRRQLEQAQRDLERAECEQNHDAIIRLRYRIIPHLEKQIQRLSQDSSSPIANTGMTGCFKTIWRARHLQRSDVSHPLLPIVVDALIDQPILQSGDEKGKAPVVSTQ